MEVAISAVVTISMGMTSPATIPALFSSTRLWEIFGSKRTPRPPSTRARIAAAQRRTLEGKPRLFGNGGDGNCDIGAFEFGAEIEPPQPLGLVAEYLLNAGSGTTAVNTAEATVGTQDGTLNSAGWTTPGLVGASDFATNGSRWITITPGGGMRGATTEFGISGWWQGTGAGEGTGGCHLFSDGDSKLAGIATNGNLACVFYDGANWNVAVSTSVNMKDGQVHHWSCSYQAGGDGLRARFDNASVAQLARSDNVSYTLGAQAFIGRHGGGSTDYTCGTGTIGNVRVFDQYITDLGNEQLYLERVPTMGLSSTHWRFYQNNAAEGTTIAGQGVDAPNIVQARSGTLLMGWNIKRNGSTVNNHFSLECNLNGGAFAQLDNSCVVNPACIAPDSVKNMGDATTNLGDIPGDGFTFTPGRYVVDTINSGLQTSARRWVLHHMAVWPGVPTNAGP